MCGCKLLVEEVTKIDSESQEMFHPSEKSIVEKELPQYEIGEPVGAY